MLLPVVLAVLGAVLVLLQNHTYGPGLHWDSVNYISVARSLLAGEGFLEFLGFDYNAWPPLYPILLAMPGLLFGIDPHAAAGPLNALLFGLTVFAAARWLLERITSRWLALWGGLAAAFSIPLTFFSSWALSETAFILFVTLALFSMDRYLRDNRRAALMWAGLFTALVCLTRYNGGILLIVPLMALLLQPGAGLLEKMKRSAVFALLAAAPVSLWLLRITLIVGRPFGAKQDPPPDESIARYVNVALTELVEWILPKMPSAYVPLDEPRRLAAALTAAALLMLAIVIGFLLIRLYRRPALWRSWRLLFLCGGFALIYFISMGIMSEIVWVGLGTDNRRYWSPVYIPLLFALVFTLDRLLMWLRSARPPAVRAFASGILAFLLLIWLGSVIAVSRQTVIRANGGYGQDEITHLVKGYAAPGWATNDAIQFMQKTQTKHSSIHSNKPAGLYVHTDPDSLFRSLPQDPKWLEPMINWALEYPYDAYLVWFNDSIPVPPQSAGYGLPELDAIPALERIATLQSGVVFQVNRQQASEA